MKDNEHLFDEFGQERYADIFRRIREIRAGASTSYFIEDVRTKKVEVTRIELGIGPRTWQDENGEVLVPSGYIPAADALECLEEAERLFLHARRNAKRFSDAIDSMKDGRAVAFKDLNEEIARLRKQLSTARKRIRELSSRDLSPVPKLKKRKKKADPMKRVR
jgi:hypothetical protein